MINNYNKSVDSIKSQELAITKVKNKIEELQLLKDTGFINEKEKIKLQELTDKLGLLESKLTETKNRANQIGNEIKDAFGKKKNMFNLNGFDEIGKKIDSFKTKVSRLIGTAMVFSLIRSQLTNLRNGFISLLKTNSTFSSSLNQIKANLMTAFAPIYNACLPAINSLMNALSKITGTIAMFVSSLFGVSLKDAKNQAKGLSKALKDTKKNGDKAAGSLASFDKLEVINSGGSAGGVDSGSGSGIDYSGEIQYSQKLLDFLNAIKNFVIENKDLVIAFLFGVAGAILAIKINCELLTALGIGVMIMGIVMLIQDVIKFLKDPTWEGFGKILTDIGVILLGLSMVFQSWPLLIAAGIALIVGLIIKNWDAIKAVLGQIGKWIYETVIKPVIDFFVGLWNGVSNAAIGCVNFIKEAWKLVATWFNNTIIQPIVIFFAGMWNGLVNGASAAWNGIKSVFSTVVSFFKNIFTNAWSAVKSVFSTGGKIFDGIKDGIVTAFTTIVNGIISGINKVVAAPFNGINTVLKKIKSIDIMGIKPFNWVATINVPQIPKLATGAVIPPRHEFSAILGDQKHGTNIEAPLETIKQANREVLEEFMNKYMSNMSDEERDIIIEEMNITAKFGDADVGTVALKGLRAKEKSLGKPLLVS